MFTGIIAEVGTLEAIDFGKETARIRVRAERTAREMHSGSSIAVNGVCLTATQVEPPLFWADLSGETLARTAFKTIRAGARLNLEQPLAPATPLGGHIVQGHVDGTGVFQALERDGENWTLRVELPEALERYAIEKGSIAIDGISLTVAALKENLVEVAIIPYTYENTDLAALEPGDPVNIECDVLAKYVEKFLTAWRTPHQGESKVTLQRLLEEGF